MAQGGAKVRVKPPAFQRDSIGLGRHGRTWQTLEARELEAGDIIKGAGLAQTVQVDADGVEVQLLMGDTVIYRPDQRVEAFSKKQILTDDSQ